jgi:hypothetical protein
MGCWAQQRLSSHTAQPVFDFSPPSLSRNVWIFDLFPCWEAGPARQRQGQQISSLLWLRPSCPSVYLPIHLIYHVCLCRSGRVGQPKSRPLCSRTTECTTPLVRPPITQNLRRRLVLNKWSSASPQKSKVLHATDTRAGRPHPIFIWPTGPTLILFDCGQSSILKLSSPVGVSKPKLRISPGKK